MMRAWIVAALCAELAHCFVPTRLVHSRRAAGVVRLAAPVRDDATSLLFPTTGLLPKEETQAGEFVR